MTNPFADAITQGLGGLLGGIEKAQGRNQLEDLMQRAQAGDQMAMAELAQIAPNSAKVMMGQSEQASKQAEQENQLRFRRMANIATTARALEEPVKIRAFIQNELRQEQDPEIREELADTLSMSDDALLFDLDSAIASAKANLGEMVGGQGEGLTEFQRQNLDLQRQRLDQSSQPSRTTAKKNLEEYQRLKKSDPELAEQFGKSVGLVSDEGDELSVHLQRRLSLASDEAAESRASAAEYDSLANNISKANITGGVFGKWKDAIKDITGNQDEVSNLRKKYFAIRSSQVVKNLPPGSASDVDIALALEGFPTEKASGSQIASFLRGVSKMERLNDEFNTFKADYISSEGTERGMLSEWRNQAKDVEAEDDKPEEPPVTPESKMQERFDALPEAEKAKVWDQLSEEEKRQLRYKGKPSTRFQRRSR